MNPQLKNEPDLKALLKESLGPTPELSFETDLWPRIALRKNKPNWNVAWWDWAVLALTAGVCSLFPEMIPGLLYHL